MPSRVTFATVGVLVVGALLLFLPVSRGQDAEGDGKAYLGIAGESTPDGAKTAGVVLRDVEAGSPAAKAGLKSGDLITRLDGKDVSSFAKLANLVRKHKAGDKITFGVAGDEGKEREVTVTLGARPGGIRPVPPFPGGGDGAFLGVQTRRADKGAEVTEVLPGSPAAKAGLKEDDVITQAGGQDITSPEELRDAVRKTGAGKELALGVLRGKEKLELKAQLQEPKRGNFPFPEGVRPFPGGGRVPDFMEMGTKMREMERKVQDLEKRVRELESKLGEKK